MRRAKKLQGKLINTFLLSLKQIRLFYFYASIFVVKKGDEFSLFYSKINYKSIKQKNILLKLNLYSKDNFQKDNKLGNKLIKDENFKTSII